MDATTNLTKIATREISKGFTATLLEIDATQTVKGQANEIFNGLISEDRWLAEGNDGDHRVVWFKLEDRKGGLKGVGVQRHGHAVMLSPGFFNERGKFLTYGLTGTDILRLDEEEPEKVIARVIRRARKLEIV